jgi:hypothetical protein
MNRRHFISLTLALAPTLLIAAKKKRIPPDLRNIVTEVDQAKKSVTITAMHNKSTSVLTMADAKNYPNEVIINGETKTFADISTGLQYMTSIEVAPGVIQSITLRTADPAPK